MAEKLGYRPGLDGLRGLAVLGVIVGHASFGGSIASVGVTVFFVLSGFLITKLLLEEQDRDGSVSLRGFYLRRARRLLPALPAVLAVCVLVDVARGVPFAANLAAAVGYGSNIWQALGHDGGSFAHLWSLAVEEQFYLVWPLVFLWVPRRRLLTVCLVGAAVFFYSRHFLDAGVAGDRLLKGDGLLLGCGLAVLLHAGRRIPTGHLGWVLVAVATLDGVPLPPVPLAALGGVLLVVDQLERPTLTHPAVVRIGRISYGIYLWHYPLHVIFDRLDPLTELVLVSVLSILAAELSYRVIESRFLRRRSVEDLGRMRSNPAPARLAMAGDLRG